MKRVLLAIGLVALLTVGYFAFIYKPCKEPTDIEVANAILDCAKQYFEMPPEALRADFCSILNKQADCEFSEEEAFIIIAELDKRIIACSNVKLKANNMCVRDQVKKFIDSTRGKSN